MEASRNRHPIHRAAPYQISLRACLGWLLAFSLFFALCTYGVIPLANELGIAAVIIGMIVGLALMFDGVITILEALFLPALKNILNDTSDDFSLGRAEQINRGVCFVLSGCSVLALVLSPLLLQSVN